MAHFANKDIVARLRDAEPCADGYPCNLREAKSGCCCAEAADKIEQLRAACKLMDEFGKLEEHDCTDSMWTPEYRNVIETAREALKD